LIGIRQLVSTCAAVEDAGRWSWSVVACGADMLFLLRLFEPAHSPVASHCPHSHASGVVVFIGFVRLVLVGSFGWLLLCVATAKWLLGAADVSFSFLSLQHQGGVSYKPCQRSFYLYKPLTTFESLLAFGPPSGVGRLRLTGFMACHVTSVADGQWSASPRSFRSSLLKWGW
jgi:hypothetical protein